MAGSQSFDITSGCDLQEVDNAINQARKEINQRYDFKGTKSAIDFERGENRIVLRGPDEFKLRALWDVLQEKLIRRKVPVRNMQPGKVLPAAGGSVSQEISLQQGIPGDTARAIVKCIKDQKVKRLQSEIQGEQVRVSSPSRDDLQAIMKVLREQDFGIELNFGNYRST
jgi:uncharacterized protein YajQ (UPF0234 family)